MADYQVVVKLVDQTRAPLRNIENGLQSIQTRTNAVNKSLAGLGAGLARAGAVAGAALSAAAVSAVRYADAVTDASQASGVGVSTILALGQAITVSGGDASNAQAAVIKFANAVGDAAAGSEAGRKAFERAGVSLKDLGTLSEQDLLKKTLEGLGGITNTAARAAATTDIFGKTLKGVNVSAFSGNLAKLTAEQEKNAAATESAADLVDNLKASFGRLQANILNAIKPAADFINTLSPNQIDRIVTTVSALGAAFLALSTAVVVVRSLRSAVLGLSGAITVLNLAILPLTAIYTTALLVSGAILALSLSVTNGGKTWDDWTSAIGRAYDGALRFFNLSDKSVPPTAADFQRTDKDTTPVPLPRGAGRATPEPILVGFYDSIAKARKEFLLFKSLINSKDLVVASSAFEKLSSAADTLGIAIEKPNALIKRDFTISVQKNTEALRIESITMRDVAGQTQLFSNELLAAENAIDLVSMRLDNAGLMAAKFYGELLAGANAVRETEMRLADVQLQTGLYRQELRNSASALLDQEQRLASTSLQQGLFDQSIRSTRLSVTQQTQTLELLNAAFALGTISLDEYSDALGGLNARLLGANQIMAQAQSSAAQEVKLTADRKIAVEQLTAAYAASGGTGTKAFLAAANALGATKVDILTATTAYQSYADKIVEYNDMIKLSVENAATTFSDEFSQAFLKGENMLSSFKNFFSNIMNDIANNIIKKQLADPIAAAMNGIITGFLGSSGSSSGGFLSGLFSSGVEQLSGPTGGGFFDSLTSLFGFANGGLIGAGTTGLVGENGPEFITGPANITPMDQMAGGSSAPNVNITINAIDTQTGVQFLLQNKPAIVSMVTDAYNRRGRSGPLD